MVVGATEIWNKALINSWRVLRSNHKAQEQNEPALDSDVDYHHGQLKSLSSLFSLLYPSGMLQTSCICLALTDFLSELPRSVAVIDTQTCHKAPQDTPIIYLDGFIFSSFDFGVLSDEMTSWLCLPCDYSPGSSVAVWEFQ